MTTTINADNGAVSGSAGLKSSADATGVLALQTNGTTAVTVDASQIVGIGITPSAWGSGSKALQMSSGPALFGTSNNGVLANNIYYDGTNYRYVATSGASLYLSSTSGANILYSAPSGTAGNVVTFTQVFAVQKDQSLALQGASPAAGTGITFPAAVNASSDVNTLDDYEEGTWTPIYTGSTTNPTVTYTTNVGTYVKIGKLVYLSCRIIVSTVSGGSGILFISGIPFTGLSTNSTFGAGALGYKATWVTNGPDEFRIFSTLIECYFQTATGETAIVPSNLQSTTDLVMNITYQTT